MESPTCIAAAMNISQKNYCSNTEGNNRLLVRHSVKARHILLTHQILPAISARIND